MEFVRLISIYAIPVVFLLILTSGFIKDIKLYDAFVDGAKEGFNAIIRIIPTLVGLMVAVGVFRASGAMDILIYVLKPVAVILGVPPEALPLALLRPVSGSASLALVSDMLSRYGPDSYIGRLVSTMMGSTETIFYTVTVYFGAVGIKNTRYTIAAALFADFFGVIAAVWGCTLVFGR